MQRVLRTLFLAIVLAAVCSVSHGNEQVAAKPAVEVEKREYEFGQVVQGAVVQHDFKVFNRGNADLQIEGVKPG